jgi:hypothetical protein
MHPVEDKSDDTNNNFYEKLEYVFDQFPNYHMKILLGEFNAKAGQEDIFNQLGTRVYMKLVMIKREEYYPKKSIKSTIFPPHKIQTYTWTSPDGKTHNQTDYILTDDNQGYLVPNLLQYRVIPCQNQCSSQPNSYYLMEIADTLGIMDVSIHTNFECSKWNSFETVVVQNFQNSGILGKSCYLIMMTNSGPIRARQLNQVCWRADATSVICLRGLLLREKL